MSLNKNDSHQLLNDNDYHLSSIDFGQVTGDTDVPVAAAHWAIRRATFGAEFGVCCRVARNSRWRSAAANCPF
jgi:hypothetical protein